MPFTVDSGNGSGAYVEDEVEASDPVFLVDELFNNIVDELGNKIIVQDSEGYALDAQSATVDYTEDEALNTGTYTPDNTKESNAY